MCLTTRSLPLGWRELTKEKRVTKPPVHHFDRVFWSWYIYLYIFLYIYSFSWQDQTKNIQALKKASNQPRGKGRKFYSLSQVQRPGVYYSAYSPAGLPIPTGSLGYLHSYTPAIRHPWYMLLPGNSKLCPHLLLIVKQKLGCHWFKKKSIPKLQKPNHGLSLWQKHRIQGLPAPSSPLHPLHYTVFLLPHPSQFDISHRVKSPPCLRRLLHHLQGTTASL